MEPSVNACTLVAGDPAIQSAQSFFSQGVVAFEARDFATALKLATQATQASPQEAVYFNLLGASFYHLGKLNEAVSAYRQAIAINPKFAAFYTNLVLALSDLDQLAEAEAAARQLVQLTPDQQSSLCNLVLILLQAGKIDEALAAFQEALKLPLQNVNDMRNVATVFLELGQFANARACYQAILRRNRRDGRSYEKLSLFRQFTAAELPTCTAIEAILMDRTLSVADKTSLHFALGKMYEDIGKYDESFEHYRAGNEINQVPSDRRTHEKFVDLLIAHFTPALFESRQGQGSNSDRPIFVVGMFRSGTTLVEQVLASHPQVYGAGELTEIPAILTSLFDSQSGRQFPDTLEALTAADVHRLAEDYLGRRQRNCGSAQRIVDKMPKNFLGLGMIALLFPRARVIHCRRDPRDVAISCYAKNFAEASSYTNNLADIGFYYRQYDRLMKRWHAILPLPILDVQYEEFVSNQATMTRKLLDFCGLPWDDACLHFQKTKRRVATASHWQVRQPLYATSIDRWRKFGRHMGPFLDELKLAELDS